MNRTKTPTFPRRLVAAWCLIAIVSGLVGCAIRWRGQEAVAIDPDFDAWLHHPQTGRTNAPAD